MTYALRAGRQISAGAARIARQVRLIYDQQCLGLDSTLAVEVLVLLCQSQQLQLAAYKHHQSTRFDNFLQNRERFDRHVGRRALGQ